MEHSKRLGIGATPNKQLTIYLVELAVNNPQQVPQALMGLMVYRQILMMLDTFSTTFETHTSQFDEELKRLLDGGKENL